MRVAVLHRVSASVESLPFWVFLTGLFIRALPEFFSGRYPVGFDLLAGYVPSIFALPDMSPLKLFGWAYSPLAVFLLWFVHVVTNVDPYLLLKVAGPVFYGFFILSFYYLLLHGLGWNSKKSFLVTLLFLLQPAVLRTGWDQLREELGLVFFFLLLAKTKCDIVAGAVAKPLMVFVLSLLIMFSHQLVGVLFFVVFLWQLINTIIKKDACFLKPFLVVVPSAVIFMWQWYSQFVIPSFSSHYAPIQLPTGTDNFVFTNYFLSDPRFLDGDYLKVLSYVGSLSLYSVIPLVPLAVKGFFKDRVFTPMMLWLSAASYSIVVYPSYAISAYWWWILLLPIPLTVFAGEGLDRLGVLSAGRVSVRKAVFWAALFLLGLLAFGYAGSFVRLGYPNAYSYIPMGLVESSVSFTDIPDIENAFRWLDQNALLDAIIIVPERFQGLAFINLRSDLRIRVAPSLLNLNNVIEKTSVSRISAYAVFYSDEVGQLSNIEALAKFGSVNVFAFKEIR